MMLKTVVPMLVQRYRLALASGARIDRDPNIAPAPRHGTPMSVGTHDSFVRGIIREIVALEDRDATAWRAAGTLACRVACDLKSGM